MDAEQPPASFSEQLFQLSYQLCKEFPSLTPFTVEKEKFKKVIRLYADVRKLQIRESKNTPVTDTHSNNQKIRRPARDNWF